MKLVVRPVKFQRDSSVLVGVLQRNLTDLNHQRRFDWLYFANPAGLAWSWFVYDGEREDPIGAATVFPRFFWVGGREKRGGQVADFAVDAGYRSLGPALRLQRATLELVDRDILEFVYDCPPHDRGMATFRRLGLSPLCRMTRFTRLERVDGVVRRIPGGPLLRTPLNALGNALLGLRGKASRRTGGVEVKRFEDPFDEEFDELDRRVAQAHDAVRSRRKAEDLNWRYRLDPLHDYCVLVARPSNELAGFVVCSETETVMNLIDLVAVDETTHLALLEAVCSEARSRGKVSVQTCIVDPSREANMVRKAGFLRRGSADRIVVYPPIDRGSSHGPPSAGWALSYVDTIA